MNWDNEIYELETFFNNAQLPIHEVEINPWAKITDVKKFIDSHLSVLKANNGNKTYIPYLDRLQEFKTYLEKQKQ